MSSQKPSQNRRGVNIPKGSESGGGSWESRRIRQIQDRFDSAASRFNEAMKGYDLMEIILSEAELDAARMDVVRFVSW